MRKRNLLSTLVAFLFATTNLSAGVADTADDGKLPGAFTVQGSPKKVVYFSQGNLQYIGSASTPYWKFADEQYEYFGDNGQNSTATDVDRDYFEFGTKDDPWCNSAQNNHSWAEWGENAISNGGNVANSDWRTLTTGEWSYLLGSRSASTINGTSNARFARAYLFGTTRGIILFPDQYTHPAGVAYPTNINQNAPSSSFTINQYSSEDWAKMEAAGCVFLPFAGMRYANSGSPSSYQFSGVDYEVRYWCYGSNRNAFVIRSSGTQAINGSTTSFAYAFSVRLVSDIPPLPAAVITSVPTAISDLTYTGFAQNLVNAGETEGGTMLYSLDGTNWSADIPQGMNATTYTVYYKVQGDGVTHKDYTPSPNTFDVTISPANIVMPTISSDLTYTGSAQPLLDITGIVGGTIYYSVDGNEPWLPVCPSETEIGTYDIWYKVDAANANYNSIPATKVTVTIDDPYPFVADNADPSATLTSLLNTPSDLKVKRTIYADDEYNTLCLPFALDASALAASPLAGFNRLKTFKGAQVSGTAPDLYIDIFVEDATTIEAGVPYLITYPSAHADIVDPVFNDVTVTTTEPSAVSVDGITFQGMFAQVHIDPYDAGHTQDYLFVGANSQLYWPLSTQTSSDIKMRGFRAYFIIDRNSISPALAPKGTRARIMDAPKTTTAIDNASAKFGGSEKIIENGILYIIRNGVKYNAQGQVIK